VCIHYTEVIYFRIVLNYTCHVSRGMVNIQNNYCGMSRMTHTTSEADETISVNFGKSFVSNLKY